jgi:hypothetical protein
VAGRFAVGGEFVWGLRTRDAGKLNTSEEHQNVDLFSGLFDNVYTNYIDTNGMKQ